MIAQHGANITSVDIIEERQTYFEIEVTDEAAAVIEDLSKLPIVRSIKQGNRQIQFGPVETQSLLTSFSISRTRVNLDYSHFRVSHQRLSATIDQMDSTNPKGQAP